jgi:serine/threonine protein kinase/DNA-binding beta-propeller fold protein YncE
MGELPAGAVLGGCRIEDVVGRGGMGVVHRARQLDLDRVVALKLIAPELIEDAVARERFLREARAAAVVDHANVLPVHGAGIEDGRAYLIMRYVQGHDVRDEVRKHGALEPQRAAELTQAVGRALDAIHRTGYVHRDVKPANVLIDEDGHVYLSDFGLAKHALTSGGLTADDRWVGTLDFAAPEQIRGDPVDARTDVYALGCLLFFMLCGRVPFDRDSDAAKLWAHLGDEPPRASEARPGVPPAFDGMVRRALAKDPAERQQSAGELGRAATTAAATVSGSDTLPAARTVRRRRWRRPSRWVFAAALLVIAAVPAALVLTGDDPRGSPEDRRTSTAGPTPTASDPTVGATLHGMGRRPRSVAVAGGDVWVISHERARPTRIDGATSRRLADAPRIGAGAWSIVADGDRLWVTIPRRMEIVGIDARTGRIAATFPTEVTPVGIAPSPRGLWVTGRGIDVDARALRPGTPDVLMQYDRDGNLLRSVEVPQGVRATAIGAGALWVSLWDVAEIEKRSAADGSALGRVDLDDAHATALAFGGGRLWAAVAARGTVAAVDPRRRTHIDNTVGPNPAHLAVAPPYVYVAMNTDHKVQLLNVQDGTPTGRSLPVPLNPIGVAADSDHVWVTGSGEGTLTRIDR